MQWTCQKYQDFWKYRGCLKKCRFSSEGNRNRNVFTRGIHPYFNQRPNYNVNYNQNRNPNPNFDQNPNPGQSFEVICYLCYSPEHTSTNCNKKINFNLQLLKQQQFQEREFNKQEKSNNLCGKGAQSRA